MTRTLPHSWPRRPGTWRVAGAASRARSVVPAVPLLLATALWGAAGAAVAQYKVVEPGGRVTYTDRPPSFGAVAAPGGQASPGAGNTAAGELAALSAGLPYTLRQVVQRYPVRLYATSACAPCDAARQYLQRRGVPWLEYSVNRSEDGELLQREVGGTELPTLTVGRQRLVGFSEADWQQTLDAAGYPATSQLPSGYRAPTPRPLAGPATARREATSAPEADNAPTPAPATTVSPLTPGGFRF